MSRGFAVIVVNYGSHELLAQNFTGEDWTRSDATLFVVDNFTSTPELESLEALGADHDWRIIASPENVGFGSGIELGVNAALAEGFENLIFVNPDLVVDHKTLGELYEQVSASPMVMVSPKIVTTSGRIWFDGGSVDVASGQVKTTGHADMDAPFAWLTGACLAISAQLWKLSGGFDPEYFLYWEDVDFSQRVTGAGGRLLVRYDLEVVHDVGGTQGDGKSATYLRYNTRNRLLFAAKWLPRRGVRSWVRHTPAQSYRVLVRSGRKSLLQASMLRAVVTGTSQGVRAACAPKKHRRARQALTGSAS
ncbi:MAG: glycosyltransferase family 2 protein [Candidatus Nanopelagicales bacterium]